MTDPNPPGPDGPQDGGFLWEGDDSPLPADDNQPDDDKPSRRPSDATLLVSVVAVAVLAIGALAVTGFIAPGFFLAGDVTPPGHTGADIERGPGPLAEAIVDGFNRKDDEALRDLLCRHADEDVTEVVTTTSDVHRAMLAAEVRQLTQTQAEADVQMTVNGVPTTATVQFALQDNKWCWQDVSLTAVPPTSASPQPGPAATGSPGGNDSTSVMQQFVSAVNAGDAAAAGGMTCADYEGTVDPAVRSAIGGAADVRFDGTPSGGTANNSVDLIGKQGGRPASGLLSATKDSGSTWCVDYFSFY